MTAVAQRTAVVAPHGPPSASPSSSDRTNIVSLNDENVLAGWVELLSRYCWDCFATLTYSEPVRTSEKVLRDFRRWLWEWQLLTAVERGLAEVEVKVKKDAYGRTIKRYQDVRGPWANNYRKGRARPVTVLGVENHRSGLLHAHALIAWSPLLADLDRRLGWSLWFRGRDEGGFGHGMARIEAPRIQEDVVSYVGKYVAKAGELYLSPSFDAATLVAAG
ncbi:MAG: hypothetical protein AAFX05_09235 [Planctomycetota bacterium]